MVLNKSEVEELFNEILKEYGYDFTGYSRASLFRRVERFLTNRDLHDIKRLKENIFHNTSNLELFIQELTVNVTEMFRDPSFYFALRKKVIPILSTYPYIKIWDAGCSTGEELFSLCILLKEEKLLERTKIYATDLNQKVLREAKEGIFDMRGMTQYTKNYYDAGGKNNFSNYYKAHYNAAKFDPMLIKNVVFYPHNLATDGVFNEFHLIICRNVLIYFSKELQDRVTNLFLESLAPLGYLGLGKKESLLISKHKTQFEILDKEEKIFRRIIN